MGKIIKNATTKHGLISKIGFKPKFGLKLGERNRRERREGEMKEEEEEEEKGRAKKVWIL